MPIDLIGLITEFAHESTSSLTIDLHNKNKHMLKFNDPIKAVDLAVAHQIVKESIDLRDYMM